MTFTCTYRDKSGVRRTTVIEAQNRSDAMSQLSSQGIRPLSLVQGGKLPRQGSSSGSPKVSNGVMAGILVVVLALGAAYFMGLFDAKRPASPTDAPDVESPAAKKAPSQVEKQPAKEKVSKAPPAAKARNVAEGKESPRAEVVSAVTEEETEEATTNDVAAVDPATTNKHKRVFKTAAEELLVLATPSTPGATVPPLPHITDEGLAKDLAKAMSNVIKADADDTEKTLSMKLNVAEQKEEFRKLRKEEGWTFTEYVNALREKFNDDAAYLAEARKLNDELYKDETLTDADYEKNKKQINEELKKRGLPPLDDDGAESSVRSNTSVNQ